MNFHIKHYNNFRTFFRENRDNRGVYIGKVDMPHEEIYVGSCGANPRKTPKDGEYVHASVSSRYSTGHEIFPQNFSIDWFEYENTTRPFPGKGKSGIERKTNRDHFLRVNSHEYRKPQIKLCATLENVMVQFIRETLPQPCANIATVRCEQVISYRDFFQIHTFSGDIPEWLINHVKIKTIF